MLLVEIESPWSVHLDRVVKPVEYAQAGVPLVWRVEREGPPAVNMYDFSDGTLEGPVPLDELLAGEPPVL